MMRLYLRFYAALLASLMLFVVATLMLWQFIGGSMEQTGVTLGRLVQNVLPPANSPPAEQQEGLRRLAAGINGNITLFTHEGVPIAAVGQTLPAPNPRHPRPIGIYPWDHRPVSFVQLADGRWLAATVPIATSHARWVFHLLVLGIAVAIGLAAFPIVRQISRRLERLQHGVESLGAGNLSARVTVEGRDEVARLAESFNRAASQIEQLVQAHKSLLANASHELRTPLARIRLSVELMKEAADEKHRIGLEQDIAELDQLVGEILLASRLDVVTQNLATEDLDLLALAAEECARYEEDIQLEGAPINIRGDRHLLRRLVRNLLENARRHGRPPTHLRITRENDSAVIKVWDEGPGIPPAEFENVFRPFYRPRDAQEATGNGLGLSLVRQIARLHGGEARCIVLEEGRSGFAITLPA